MNLKGKNQWSIQPAKNKFLLVMVRNFIKEEKMKKTKILTCVVLIMVCCIMLHSIIFDAGAEEKEVPTNASPERMEEFNRWKFGMFIHWGPWSQSGIGGIWRGRHGKNKKTGKDNWTPKEEVQKCLDLNKTFNPVNFDASKWADKAKKAGMRYVVFTTKHHDGFCNYDTKLTDYRSTHSSCPFSSDPRADITREVINAFRKAGLAIGLYYSHPDFHHPDGAWQFWDDNFDPKFAEKYPDRWKNWVKFEKGQVEELLSNYGKIDLVWFDIGWPRRLQPDAVPMLKMMRRLQPDLILDNRGTGKYADYKTPEQTIPGKPPKKAWETCMTLSDGGGFWYKGPNATYKTPLELIYKLAEIASKGGNFLLNVGPKPDGTLPQGEIDGLLGVGEWMKVNGESIYGTRAWTIFNDGPDIRFTRSNDGKYLYAICFKRPGKKLRLETVRAKEGSKISMLGYKGTLGNKSLKWKQDNNALLIDIPAKLQSKQGRPCKHAWVFKIEAVKPALRPTIKPKGGVFNRSGITVKMSTKTKNAEILYTLDGSKPIFGSKIYKGKLVLKKSARIRARAFKPGMGLSQIASADFRVGMLDAADLSASDLENGLDYEFYKGKWRRIPDFDTLDPVKTGKKNNFKIEKGDNFGMRFSGYIKIPNDGKYTFSTRSDDGSKMHIDGYPVVDNDGRRVGKAKQESILLRGGMHKIVVTYIEKKGGEMLRVNYKEPDMKKSVSIPDSMLYRKK